MNISNTAPGIYKLTTNIENVLFEGLWEIPDGVSLNSYVVHGKKTALLDGFCGWDGVPEQFFAMLNEMNLSLEDIHYIIIHHMEPDHSGWIEQVRKLKPDVKILCTHAAKNLLQAFYGEIGAVQVVRDGDTLDLGNGKILTFYTIPNVHWPDTMVSLEASSGTLFSCDAFGSYGIIQGEGYDENLSQADEVFYEQEALRYYANIIAAFSDFTKRALDKLSPLPIRIIAPGHGIVWRKNPQKILSDYLRYTQYQKGPAKAEITLIWGSMYGMTKRAVDKIVSILNQSGLPFRIFEVPATSWGMILGAAWASSGIILAMPTYEHKMFPPMAAILEELGKKKVQNKIAFRVGSYGWSGGAEKELAQITERQGMNWQFLPSVEFNGAPSQDDLNQIETSIQEMVAQIKKQTRS